MKIVRFTKDNRKSYGILKEGKIQIINGGVFDDYNLSDEVLNLEEVVLENPVNPPNIIAVGLNYQKHAEEGSQDFGRLPDAPVLFVKTTNSVIGPEQDIKLPLSAPNEVDYEAELAVIIGKKAKNIEKEEVADYILGYTCGNDVSARDCQLRIDKQWARGKSFDTFCPLGPWLETELNPDNCKIQSRLNGRVMQNSNTSNMIFSAAEIISYCSKNMTLFPGTVIMTGTPEGVGFAREEPVFLREGDLIEIEIEGIGVLKNTVIKER
ncbi:fumarylacetoacetate hydrolase family protein [Halocella sp. SP3-1]|uniref:fumarylacetoacetate hydrolase family protein n=1 Tax=Halocella sp. SP3-1 TaxID=2382161 RepID=UPI000F754243|nr:fumarylacetoacetate hydrolase family protein [Halocella sp. SP3-1]AZO95483.1 FAA hydrolase family protein [Halocella sp. SP3-1]